MHWEHGQFLDRDPGPGHWVLGQEVKSDHQPMKTTWAQPFQKALSVDSAMTNGGETSPRTMTVAYQLTHILSYFARHFDGFRPHHIPGRPLWSSQER